MEDAPVLAFEEAARNLVMKCIELYGPAHIPLIRYHTGLGYDEIHWAIDRLETDQRILRLAVVDGSSIDMFITPKELEELKVMPRTATWKAPLRPASRRASWPSLASLTSVKPALFQAVSSAREVPSKGVSAGLGSGADFRFRSPDASAPGKSKR